MDSSRIVRTVRIVLSRFCSEGPAQNPQDTGTKEQPGTESFWFPSAPRAGPVPKYSIHKYLGERSVSQECWYAYEHRWDYDLCSEVPSWNPQDTRIKEHPRTGSFKFLSAPRINPLIYPKSSRWDQRVNTSFLLWIGNKIPMKGVTECFLIRVGTCSEQKKSSLLLEVNADNANSSLINVLKTNDF
jgi:hypothetical protein